MVQVGDEDWELGVWFHPSSIGLGGISSVDLSRHCMIFNISRC